MEAEGSVNRRGKRTTRKEVLEKKKAIESIIKAASSVKDHLSFFWSFRHYRANGFYAHLESGRGNKLTLHTKKYIQNLLKLNMEVPYGPEWPAEEKIKRREMVAEEARYIFVHEVSSEDEDEVSQLHGQERTCNCQGPIVGFVHYRLILEEEVPVVYVYELQLEPRVQGKGLGKLLMQLIELIACKNRMGAVVLTVQKANRLAMDFYIGKLRYKISAISPSRVDPLLGPEKSYEILCKTFDHEAQAVLEGSCHSFREPKRYTVAVCRKYGACQNKVNKVRKIAPAIHTRGLGFFLADAVGVLQEILCVPVYVLHRYFSVCGHRLCHRKLSAYTQNKSLSHVSKI